MNTRTKRSNTLPVSVSRITPPRVATRAINLQPRRPLTTWHEFERVHQKADAQQRAYQERGTKQTIFLSHDVMEELEPSWAQHLPANNLDARLNFAWLLSSAMDPLARSATAHRTFLFVTVVVREHTVREDEAIEFNANRVRSLGHQWLRGCHYVAMVEAALYTNFKRTGAGFDRAVSWHFHAVVWGVSEREIKKIRDTINRRYKTSVDGISPAHYRLLTPGEVKGHCLYMTKGQVYSYKVWARKKRLKGVNADDQLVLSGRFRQRKEYARPGEMARMYRVFGSRYLDQLAFAGGEGKPLLKEVILKAARRGAKRLRLA